MEPKELSEVNQEITCQLTELQEANKKQLAINTSPSEKITSQCETSGGSRPGHQVSGTWSKFPKLSECRQKSHFQ